MCCDLTEWVHVECSKFKFYLTSLFFLLNASGGNNRQGKESEKYQNLSKYPFIQLTLLVLFFSWKIKQISWITLENKLSLHFSKPTASPPASLGNSHECDFFFYGLLIFYRCCRGQSNSNVSCALPLNARLGQWIKSLRHEVKWLSRHFCKKQLIKSSYPFLDHRSTCFELNQELNFIND